MADDPSIKTTGEINRRDFVKTTAAAYALYAASNGTQALAAGADDLAKLTVGEASRRVRAREFTSTQLTAGLSGTD